MRFRGHDRDGGGDHLHVWGAGAQQGRDSARGSQLRWSCPGCGQGESRGNIQDTGHQSRRTTERGWVCWGSFWVALSDWVLTGRDRQMILLLNNNGEFSCVASPSLYLQGCLSDTDLVSLLNSGQTEGVRRAGRRIWFIAELRANYYSRYHRILVLPIRCVRPALEWSRVRRPKYKTLFINFRWPRVTVQPRERSGWEGLFVSWLDWLIISSLLLQYNFLL